MKRIGVMAATAMIALLLALPLGLAIAQDGDTGPRPPATLFGTAMADGFAVPMGTMIVAMVGDEKIGSTEVMANGKFGPFELMAPSGEDMMVSFMVGERMSDYMYEWMSGGAEAMAMINANLVPSDETMEGMMGPEGAMGPAGPAGAAGVMGADGSMGSEGAQGAQGTQGEAGSAGANGADGTEGAAGPAGGVGPPGPTGSMGIIALIVAIVAAIVAVAAIIMGRRQTTAASA